MWWDKQAITSKTALFKLRLRYDINSWVAFRIFTPAHNESHTLPRPMRQQEAMSACLNLSLPSDAANERLPGRTVPGRTAGVRECLAAEASASKRCQCFQFSAKSWPRASNHSMLEAGRLREHSCGTLLRVIDQKAAATTSSVVAAALHRAATAARAARRCGDPLQAAL